MNIPKECDYCWKEGYECVLFEFNCECAHQICSNCVIRYVKKFTKCMDCHQYITHIKVIR